MSKSLNAANDRLTWHNATLIVRRHFLVLKKTWMNSFVWMIAEPLFNLTAIGFGLGAFVARIADRPFIEFFFPGLICSSVMMAAYFESSYGTYTKWTYSKVFRSVLYAPVSAKDVLFAELMFSTIKASCSAIGIVIVASLFGLVDSWRIFLAFSVFLTLAWAFSAFGLLVCSFARNYDSFIYSTSGVIVPFALISGVYYPIGSMPLGFQILAYLFPLSHGVALAKDILWNQITDVSALHAAALLGLTAILHFWAVRRMTKALQR